MSLPVAQYEALLAEVRGLRRKAQKVQQLATPLLSSCSVPTPSTLNQPNSKDVTNKVSYLYSVNYGMDPLITDIHKPLNTNPKLANGTSSSGESAQITNTEISISSEPNSHSNLYHGTWPVERPVWSSETNGYGAATSLTHLNRTDSSSVMSFASSSGGAPLDRILNSPDRSHHSSQQLDAKVDMVYSLLSMLGGQEHADTGETLLALSTNPESCLAMRQSGCISLLVQLVQSDKNSETQKKAAQALHNLVHSNPDEKLKKRETRVLKLLEEIRDYTTYLQNNKSADTLNKQGNGDDLHPVQSIANIMKYSFDEGNRHAICQLGGIHTIANLLESEYFIHGNATEEGNCILLRRYSCMALTNLTFGDSGNKALLCLCKNFMSALVIQLQSPCDELRQVTASVLRNLSWRADTTSKEILRNVGTVSGLMKAAMLNNKENTLKSILSALWNLSAHCTENKAEICSVDDALAFLVKMLSYKSPSKSLTIIENAGGILRNISSQIAIRDDFRTILRNHNCLQILLEQLKSPSLTVVSNACGTLWNLSAKCQIDQDLLWQLGAPAMLRSLNHSKHKMIAMGSSAALKNLLSSRQNHNLLPQLDSTAKAMDLPTLPTLTVRKQKALLQELEHNLSETFDNLDKDSPYKSFSHDAFSLENSDKVLSSASSSFRKPYKNSASCDVQQQSFTGPVSCETSNFAVEDIVPSLASLKLGESNYQSKKEIIQNFDVANSSNFQKSHISYKAVKNFCDTQYDEYVVEQHSDYSIPFNDSKKTSSTNKNMEEEEFGIYTETDLDQPTDYSLRYAEDDSEPEEICDKIEKTDFVQDTVKTYCTEDTPYETPFNYSTATSMSDLRETAIENDKQLKDNDQLANSTTSQNCKSQSHLDEKDHCSVEDVSEFDNKQNNVIKQHSVKSQFSSGLISPEKPVNYAEEGTPGYFSRVSSFGSLNSVPIDEDIRVKKKVHEDVHEKSKTSNLFDGKVVKFEQVVNYAEETPLMFSRSSSLASLDSVEQHSIHEDRESVISDFSRLTSGLVSPSELPDSPTQTIPPSPKRAAVFRSSSKGCARVSNENQSHSSSNNEQKISVFEDKVTKFKEESTPIQFSTATSLSSLIVEDYEDSSNLLLKNLNKNENSCDKLNTTNELHKNARDQVNLNEDAASISESEGDDDILMACINDGMQKNRFSQKPSMTDIPLSSKYNYSKPFSHEDIVHKNEACGINSDSVHKYFTEDTPAVLSHAGSKSNLSLLTTAANSLKEEDRNSMSDDSSNLSGDNDNILAKCIQSAMPKARTSRKSLNRRPQTSGLPLRNSQISSLAKPVSRNSNALFKNETLGNVAINSLNFYYGAKDEVETYAVENSPCHISFNSSLSDLTVDGSITGKLKFSNTSTPQKSSENSGTIKVQQSSSNKFTIEQNLLSRQELYSSSEDSLASLENDQISLEQCISFGMPKGKSKASKMPVLIESSHKPVKIKHSFAENLEVDHKDICANKNNVATNSKNVDVTSVAKNTLIELTKEEEMHQAKPTVVADVEVPDMQNIQQRQMANASLENRSSTPLKENLLIGHMKNGSENFDNFCKDETNKEDSIKEIVDNRMLDPDAMIASLDRFTAKLVLQAEAAHSNKDGKKSISISESDIWNEDTSPNDVTFPSISGSAPNVISFKSETENTDQLKTNNDVFEENENQETPPLDAIDGVEVNSNDFSSINTSTMTESTLIAVEASKMVSALKDEVTSPCLTENILSKSEQILPTCESNLSNSLNALQQQQSPAKISRSISRKRSLPSGLIARRAVTNNFVNRTLSQESLSNLDNINPPSAMGEVFDTNDLESSITSLTSLKSEVADFNYDNSQPPNPIFKVKQPVKTLHLFCNSSYSDLENINPPSIFNEISDLCNSLADVHTETIGSATEHFEDCNTHLITEDAILQTEDEVTIFSDALSVTPILSDGSSSNETSPKKKATLAKRLTPKQKRKLAQERYRTYTVAAEMVLSAEKHSSQEDDFKTVDCVSELENATEFHSLSNETIGDTSNLTHKNFKSTPQERRQKDRSRFQTQILDESTKNALSQMSKEQLPALSPKTSPAKSAPNSPRSRLNKRRLENRERFQTRTISESSLSPDVSSISPSRNGSSSGDLQGLVEKETNKVLKKLQETKFHPDELLDCETLSLVSNDDDSERNSVSSVNYRTYTKSNRLQISALTNQLGESNISSVESSDKENLTSNQSTHLTGNNSKPKIVKPEGVETSTLESKTDEFQFKAIRGRRKPLYSKSNLTSVKNSSSKPPRSITSNLVNNVTSSIKSTSATFKNATNLPARTSQTSKVIQNKFIRPPTGLRNNVSNTKTNLQSTSGVTKSKGDSPSKTTTLQRQDTFTKENTSEKPTIKNRLNATTSNIPAPKTSRIARAIVPHNSVSTKTSSKTPNLPSPKAIKNSRTTLIKSASTDRTKNNSAKGTLRGTTINRSSSADSRDSISGNQRRIHNSTSSQSLQNESKQHELSTSKRSTSNISQRSNSNSSITSDVSTSKKQVTSKIASLWKRVEEQKKIVPKKDTRVWIQAEREVSVTITSQDAENDTESF